MSDKSIQYILSLIPHYNKGTKYLLSRLRNLDMDNKVQSLFCKNCLFLFIPIINCEIELSEHLFIIKCSVCSFTLKESLESRNNIIKHNIIDKQYSYDDLFY